jgi:hypothetical protein
VHIILEYILLDPEQSGILLLHWYTGSNTAKKFVKYEHEYGAGSHFVVIRLFHPDMIQLAVQADQFG